MGMDSPYVIRPGREADLIMLPPIERAAADLFAGYWTADILEEVIPLEEQRAYLRAGRLWVAADSDDSPVGFAVVSVVGENAHLDEIAVHPDHGRRGIGRALVERVCRWAAEQNLPAVTLTTERDVPWNAPFYARLGFTILTPDALTPDLKAILADEAKRGLSPETRVAMIRTL